MRIILPHNWTNETGIFCRKVRRKVHVIAMIYRRRQAIGIGHFPSSDSVSFARLLQIVGSRKRIRRDSLSRESLIRTSVRLRNGDDFRHPVTISACWSYGQIRPSGVGFMQIA